ncbi:14543_t:CDS:2, partial [Gigaspora rosea]
QWQIPNGEVPPTIMVAPTGKILPPAIDDINNEFHHHQQRNPPTTIAIQWALSTTQPTWNRTQFTTCEKLPNYTSLDFIVGNELPPLVSSLLVKIRHCVSIVCGEIRCWCHSWDFAINIAVAS